MCEPPTSCRSDPRFVGDPIDVVTGANTDVITDVRRRGPIPFEWKRYYNSARAATLCPLGWGHSHHFDRRLIRDLDGVRYEDPHGNSVPFSDVDIGQQEAAGGLVLTRTGTDSYNLEQQGQPSEKFQFAAGATVAPVRWLRRGKHVIVLKYAANGVLADIVDSLGRAIQVASDKTGRIRQLVLTDAGGGTSLVAYEYDAAGNLARAVDRANTTLTFAFDAANRMTRRTDRRGYSFHFEYDDAGRGIHSHGHDELLEVFLTYQPDAGATFVRRGDGDQWTYNYDDNKTITQITDPYGNATKFILDETGRPVQEVDPNVNMAEAADDGGMASAIALNAAMMAATAAADAAAAAMTKQMGTDQPFIPPVGTPRMILRDSPNVMLGCFPLPSSQAIAQGLMKRIKGIKFEAGGGGGGAGCPSCG